MNFLVLADEEDGLEWLDVQAIKNPVELAQTPIGGDSSNVIIENDFAFVADGNEGLEIIDIHNPNTPQEIINYRPFENRDAVDIAIKDSYAYLLCWTALFIIDISNPFSPKQVGMIEEGGHILEVSGNHAFIIFLNEVRIIDITSPENPIHVSTYSDDYNYIEDLFLHNQIAYIAGAYFGVKKIDFSNILEPTIIGEIPAQTWSTSVFVQQNLAFIINYGTGLLIYDISDKTQPQLVSNHSYSGEYIPRILVIKNLAFIAFGRGGIEILNVSNLNNLQKVASYFEWEKVKGMDFWGNLLYLATGGSGLVILQSNSFPTIYATTTSSPIELPLLPLMSLITLSLMLLVSHQKLVNYRKQRTGRKYFPFEK